MLELWGGISERTSPFENEISLRSKGMALCKHRETLRLLVQFPRLSTALTSFEGQGIVHTYPNPSLISSVSSPFYSSHFVRGARHSSYISKPYYSKCIFFTSINSHFAALRSKGKCRPARKGGVRAGADFQKASLPKIAIVEVKRKIHTKQQNQHRKKHKNSCGARVFRF